MLKLSVCLQVNGKTVFWKCWKLFLKNFILRSSKSGGCQDDFSGLVSSFKLPHNVPGLAEDGDFPAPNFLPKRCFQIYVLFFFKTQAPPFLARPCYALFVFRSESSVKQGFSDLRSKVKPANSL